jgi:hypothetical protein
MSTKIGELSAAEINKMTPLERVTYQREREAEEMERKLEEKYGRLADPNSPDPWLAKTRTTLPIERAEITEQTYRYCEKVQENRGEIWFEEQDATGKRIDKDSLWKVVNIHGVMPAERRGFNLMVQLRKYSATETIEDRDGKRKPKPKVYPLTPLANGERTQTFIAGISFIDESNPNELSILADEFVKRFKQHVISTL